MRPHRKCTPTTSETGYSRSSQTLKSWVTSTYPAMLPAYCSDLFSLRLLPLLALAHWLVV